MNVFWNLLLGIFIMIVSERADASCSVKATCSKTTTYVHRTYKKCGWLWRSRCIKDIRYSSRTTYYTCYKPCPLPWGSWSRWTQCTYSNGHYCIGEQIRRRRRGVCFLWGHNCQSSITQDQSRSCLLKVDGGWSPWGYWNTISSCSVHCNPKFEVKIRYRYCTKPTPRCGGSHCPGSSTQHKSVCNNRICRPKEAERLNQQLQKLDLTRKSWKTLQSVQSLSRAFLNVTKG